MAFAASLTDSQPMNEINTTPLIDVMLVLLIMFVITIPAATHSLDVPMPQGGIVPDKILPRNHIVLTGGDQVLWNQEEISLAELSALLSATARMPDEPELRFQPDGSASYGLSAEVLRRIKISGVTAFGFVGNENFSEFGAPAKR